MGGEDGGKSMKVPITLSKKNIVQLMKELKADLIREDGRLERLCSHGIGHTVGTIVPARMHDKYLYTHGCDGCCRNYAYQKDTDSEEAP